MMYQTKEEIKSLATKGTNAFEESVIEAVTGADTFGGTFIRWWFVLVIFGVAYLWLF